MPLRNRPGSALLLTAMLSFSAHAFEAGPKTTAHWKFDSSGLQGNGFKNFAPSAPSALAVLPWSETPIIKDADGGKGVFCSRTGFGELPSHNDLTAGNAEKVISYGARIRLDTIRKDYSSFVAGYYDSHRFMVDTIGGFHLGIQNVGVKRPQQWVRTDSERDQPLVQPKKWHEVVFTIDATDPGRVLGYFFLDGKQQRNPHFSVNDDGVRTTGMNPFKVCKDPSDPGPPWYGSPLHGLMSELIIEKGYLIEPTLPHTGPLNNRVNLGTRSMDGEAGDTLKVPVLLTNYSDRTLSSCQFNLNVDAGVIKVIAAEKDGIAKDWNLTWNGGVGGAYAFSLAGLQTPMNYGEGAILNLTVVVGPQAKAGDFSDMTLDDVKLDQNRQLEVSTTTGRIRVQEPVLYGDVNGDGKVGVDDAALVFKYVVGVLALPDSSAPNFTVKVADVSGNGEVTSYDGALILQHVAGLLPDFPVRKPKAPAKAAYSPPAARAASAPAAVDLSLAAPEAVPGEPGVYLYRLGGSGLENMSGAEFVFSTVNGLVQEVVEVRTALRSAKLTVSGSASDGTFAASLAVTDRFQNFSEEILTVKLRQASAFKAFNVKSAYFNEGRLAGNFVSAPVRPSSSRVLGGPAPAAMLSARVASGHLEIELPGRAEFSVTLFDLAGRPLLSRRFGAGAARISLERVPMGAFGYEVRFPGGRKAGFAVRL